MAESLTGTVDRHVQVLTQHPDRHPGRSGNTAADAHVVATLHDLGWTVEVDAFEVLDCETGPAVLEIDGGGFDILPGPYSVPVDGRGRLLPIDSIEALETADMTGAVVLLHGAIAVDPLFPKSFDFIDVPEHRRIYELLERGAPLAVIGATGRGSGMSGGLYPSPFIEDGDFDLPTAYTSDTAGAALVPLTGRSARVSIEARRFTRPARQVTGWHGPAGAPRVVVIAHIDSKGGSPGAIDNAAGVAALLAVARLLTHDHGPNLVELVPMNGEDYYANPGEHRFVERYAGRWAEIVCAINLDGIGAGGAHTAASTYAMDDASRELVRRVVRRHKTVSFGEPWYESDHSIVAGHGRPAVALTSTSFRELSATITHTPRDTVDLVDPGLVAAAAEFIADPVRSLPAVGGPEA